MIQGALPHALRGQLRLLHVQALVAHFRPALKDARSVGRWNIAACAVVKWGHLGTVRRAVLQLMSGAAAGLGVSCRSEEWLLKFQLPKGPYRSGVGSIAYEVEHTDTVDKSLFVSLSKVMVGLSPVYFLAHGQRYAAKSNPCQSCYGNES